MVRPAPLRVSAFKPLGLDHVKRLPELPPLRHEELPPPLRFMISVGARSRR
jgi:hypothetical protein